MYPLKQSTAQPIPVFIHDATGAPVTGLVDGDFLKRISKDGAAFAAMTVVLTEMERGFYSMPITAAHSDTKDVLTIILDPQGTNGGVQQQLQLRVDTNLPDDLSRMVVKAPIRLVVNQQRIA